MSDTIIACATPWGRSAIALLRMSGSGSLELAQHLCPGGPSWLPRRASVRQLRQGEIILDTALVTYMPGPNSYTGEDIIEIGCHGNPVVVESIMDAAVVLGARPARPGEFTRRALEQGRMNLLEAEALAGFIDATSMAGVRMARAGLDGSVQQEVTALREQGLDMAAEIEARLDHPDDDLSHATDAEVVVALHAMADRAEVAADGWRAGRVCLHGAKVGIVGAVNAGKSSLFNRLVSHDRALVSDRPGTTRDVVEHTVVVDGLSITFLDTAGERETADELETAGIALGRVLTDDVDLLLVVRPLHQRCDDATEALVERIRSAPRLVVGTHLDRCDGSPHEVDHAVSNTTGAGIEDLVAAIRSAVGAHEPSGASVVLMSQRQHALFMEVGIGFRKAATALASDVGPAVAAEEVVRALERLGELEGRDVREEVLDRLFSRFCIGK